MPNTRPRLVALCCTLFMPALAPVTLATLVRQMDLGQMVSRSDHIVVARAADIEVVIDPVNRYQYTVTRFEVLTPIKGASRTGQSIELRLLGGRAPGSFVTTSVAGVPRFRIGEEVVLFTELAADGRHLLVGLDGAVRTVSTSGGRVVLSPPLEGTSSGPEEVELRPSTLRRHGRPRVEGVQPFRPASEGVDVQGVQRHADTEPLPPGLSLGAFLEGVRRLVDGPAGDVVDIQQEVQP